MLGLGIGLGSGLGLGLGIGLGMGLGIGCWDSASWAGTLHLVSTTSTVEVVSTAIHFFRAVTSHLMFSFSLIFTVPSFNIIKSKHGHVSAICYTGVTVSITYLFHITGLGLHDSVV